MLGQQSGDGGGGALCQGPADGVHALTERSMEAFLNLLMQHWPGVLFRQRPDLTFEFASPRLEELTGHALAQWRDHPGLLWQSIHELDVEAFKAQLGLAAQGT